MNELTEFGPENNALARRWGAQTPLVQTMASDAFPVIHADFRDMDEELLALRGDAMRAAVVGTAAAVAARFSAVGLANPSGSGVIAVLEYIRFSPGSIRIALQGAAVSALQGSTLGFPLDSRQTERASVRALLTDDDALADFGNAAWQGESSADDIEICKCFPHVLAPNSTLWVINQTVNTGQRAAFVWRQRRLATWEATGV